MECFMSIVNRISFKSLTEQSSRNCTRLVLQARTIQRTFALIFRTNALVLFTFRQDLDFATLFKFAERNLSLPGIRVNDAPVRKYVYGALAAHILGYVGAADDISKLPDINQFNYYQPQAQGIANIEKVMDHVLQGSSG